MFKTLFEGAIVTTPGTLAYTAPSGTKAEVGYIDITNTTETTIFLTLYIVRKGGAVGTSNMLFKAIAIAGNKTEMWRGRREMPTGYFIQAFGSVAGLTLTISGDEFAQ